MEEDDLLCFLRSPKVDLAQFYDKFVKDLGVKRFSHLQDVKDADLDKIGLKEIEIRRFNRQYEKKGAKKNNILHKMSKMLKPSGSSKKHAAAGKVNDPQYHQHKGDVYEVPEPVPLKGATVCLIRRDDLEVGEELGRGEFSNVKKAVWSRQEDRGKIHVAVKILKSHPGRWQQEDFIKEANMLQEVNHENIIRLYGIVITEPFMLVTELALQGSLVASLRQQPPCISIYHLCSYAKQVASGMAYLEKRKLVHRDLAARNLLLMTFDLVKITDFGLTRMVNAKNDIYRMETNSRIPIAWTAPEALTEREFSAASDAWSYGVTVWEMFSYGDEPYESMSNLQISRAIQPPNSFRLAKPHHCPTIIWEIINQCWEENPANRPSFIEIEQHIVSNFPPRVQAVKDYRGQTAGKERLNIHCKELITIIEKEGPYYLGQNENLEVGLFPAQCVAEPREGGIRSASPPPLPPPSTEAVSPTHRIYASMHPVRQQRRDSGTYRDPLDGGMYHVAAEPSGRPALVVEPGYDVPRKALPSPVPDEEIDMYEGGVDEDDFRPQQKYSARRNEAEAAERSKTERLLEEGSGKVETLRGCFPEMDESRIRSFLVLSNWDATDAFRRIKVQQLMDLGLPGFNEERCLRALEHCQFKVDRAAAWLMDSD